MSGIPQKGFNGSQAHSHLTLRVPGWLETRACHGARSRGADSAGGPGSVTRGEEVRLPALRCREPSLKTRGPKGAQGSLFSLSQLQGAQSSEQEFQALGRLEAFAAWECSAATWGLRTKGGGFLMSPSY